MASARSLLSGLSEAARDARRTVRERAPEVARRVARPRSLEKFEGATTRVSQIVTFLFLGPVIVISFVLIEVLNGIMTDILGGGGWQVDTQGTMFAWLVTAMTLGAFILAAWTWFQFVRTSGFGWFSWRD